MKRSGVEVMRPPIGVGAAGPVGVLSHRFLRGVSPMLDAVRRGVSHLADVLKLRVAVTPPFLPAFSEV